MGLTSARGAMWVVLGVAACAPTPTPTRTATPTATPTSTPTATSTPKLLDVGPRLVTDQTAAPLAVYGEGLATGMKLWLGAPLAIDLPLVAIDPEHAYTRLPSTLKLDAAQVEVVVEARLRAAWGAFVPGRAVLTLVNDAGFPDLRALVWLGGGELVAASSTTDALFALKPSGGIALPLPGGDGPSALAVWTDPKGRPWTLVGHRFAPELWLFDRDERHVLPAPPGIAGIAVDRDAAYLADEDRHEVVALELPSGRERWRAAVSPGPGPIAVAGDVVAVGCRDSGQVELLDPKTGASKGVIAPGPGTPILSGGTKGLSQYVMNGGTTRALAWSPRLKRLFLASTGPNLGPNPQRQEVSANSGVAVLDPAKGAYLRHVGFGAGTTQALALDDARGLLYAADVSLGVVRVLDAKKLAASDAAALGSVVQAIAIPPPDGFPLVRPPGDLGVQHRAGVSLHSGPQALALDAKGDTLYALDRFTGTLAVIDVRARGKAKLVKQLPVVDTLAQRERRLGQILYFADMGRTGMSCDSCHVEGGPGNALFAKTDPMRIYRSPSILGSRDTPPYFSPASDFTLEQTAATVGTRNRYHNPVMAPEEVRRLALYAKELAFPPNPFVQPDGTPPPSLVLPDGKTGDPRAGVGLFFGKAACAACHPAPEFTTDQDPATRGRYLDVGTPKYFPLRQKWQDPVPDGEEIPSLVGSWAIFPMLSSCTAGFGVDAAGKLTVATRFPARAVLETKGKRPHGNALGLGDKERNDLLAYLMTL
ncbi:MAG TPA: PQQ-binding-like beta-propeller repeat protein [Myxococcales bacterium]|nr:PQQ-binding-like beta-propeller repeat protein [Myxococcales bacterium]